MSRQKRDTKIQNLFYRTSEMIYLILYSGMKKLGRQQYNKFCNKCRKTRWAGGDSWREDWEATKVYIPV